jgi:predicted transport protein
MLLYKIIDDNLKEIKEIPFKKERELHKLCEANLERIYGLKYVCSEFSINNFRIDTLAYDQKNKTFIIIEYKKDKNFSVIDQGYAYLSLLLNNKADFILEYNECCRDTLKRKDIDWSQSKVMFVSTSFTAYQRESINFKDLPIELWEVKRFDNKTIFFNQIKPAGVKESINTVSRDNNDIEKVNKEIKVYTEEDHILNVPEYMVDLYQTFKEAIFNLGDNIELNPTKLYIGFVVNKKDITDIHILKSSLKIWINLKSGDLDDPKGIARDVSNVGHWGNGDYEIKISNDDDLEYVLSLIKQSYKKNTM